MGRPNRVQFQGACYHVVLKGNNGGPLFESDGDRERFLEFLSVEKDRQGLLLYAYVLLPSEIQLLVETPRGNLSRVMQTLLTRYTKYFNKQNGRTGHLFQGRYKAYLVDRDRHLLELTRHLHLMPVKSGQTERPWRFRWSSLKAYVESEMKQKLVDSPSLLKPFGKNRLKQSVKYLQFVKERMKAPSPSPDGLPVLIAGPAAAPSAGATSGAPAGVMNGSGHELFKPILEDVLSKHALPEEMFFSRSQRRPLVEARREAIYRAWKEAGLGVSELGRMFGRTPSAICQILRTVEQGTGSEN